jgi:tRNA uridine 5-carbamoylmethylation protein Kti12
LNFFYIYFFLVPLELIMSYDDAHTNDLRFKRTCFLLVSGCPGIGKTTFTKHLCDYIRTRKEFFKPILISYDNLIDAELEECLITSKSDKDTQNEWKQARNFIVYLVKLLVCHLGMTQDKEIDTKFKDVIEIEMSHDSQNYPSASVKSLLKKRFLNAIQESDLEQNQQANNLFNLIVLDDLFYYESMRYSYFKLAIDIECAYVSICFKPESLEFLLERNLNREIVKKLDESIVRNVWDKFEFSNENDWELNFTNLKLVTQTFKIAECYLSETLVDIVEKMKKFQAFLAKRKLDEINKERRQLESEQAFSLSHECDLVLRKLISGKLSSISGKQEKASLAREFSAKKNLILNEIKVDQNGLRTSLLDILNQNEDPEKRFAALENQLQTRFDP